MREGAIDFGPSSYILIPSVDTDNSHLPDTMPHQRGSTHLVTRILGAVHVLVKNIAVSRPALLNSLDFPKPSEISVQIFLSHLKHGNEIIRFTIIREKFLSSSSFTITAVFVVVSFNKIG